MKKNSLKPKKFFGQNFLSDFQLIEELIEEINIQEIDHLLEIGPGKGAMTSLLLEKCESLTAIEIDKDLIRFLKKAYGDRKNFNLIEKDILLYDPKELVRVNKLIGNIPYNISTPIIEWIIDNKSSFDEIFLMLQKEFGERCVAQPNTKSYGRLSINDIKSEAISKKNFSFKTSEFLIPVKLVIKGELSLGLLNNFVNCDVIRDGNSLKLLNYEVVGKNPPKNN